MSFSNLKRASSSLSKITKAIEDANKNKFASDEREWKCSQDKAGNGLATIRFLPAPSQDGDEALPWVRIFTHGFKGPGGQWLIENCPTTIGNDCPVCQHNSVLWNTGEKDNQDAVRKQKRKLVYISNVLIISDPAHPENEGQVKIFKFGKKIMDKITGLMNPDPGEEACNPFDFWNGANFKIKMKKVDQFPNYDDSKFFAPSALFDGDDEKLEIFWNKQYSLKELIEPKVFKEFAQIEDRLKRVLGSAVKTAPAAEKKETESLADKFARSKEEKTEKKEAVKQMASTPTPTLPPAELGEDEEDMKFFQDLADE